MNLNRRHFLKGSVAAGAVSLAPTTFARILADEKTSEYEKCRQNPVYFIQKYVLPQSSNSLLTATQITVVNTGIKRGESFVAIGGRQAGKSMLEHGLFVWDTVFRTFTSVTHVSATAIERDLFSRKVVELYKGLPSMFTDTAGMRSAYTLTQNSNGNTYRFLSAHQIAQMKGYSIDVLYLSDFARVPEHRAHQIMNTLIPNVSARAGGQVRVISGSSTYSHPLYDLWRNHRYTEMLLT